MCKYCFPLCSSNEILICCKDFCLYNENVLIYKPSYLLKLSVFIYCVLSHSHSHVTLVAVDLYLGPKCDISATLC